MQSADSRLTVATSGFLSCSDDQCGRKRVALVQLNKNHKRIIAFQQWKWHTHSARHWKHRPIRSWAPLSWKAAFVSLLLKQDGEKFPLPRSRWEQPRKKEKELWILERNSWIVAVFTILQTIVPQCTHRRLFFGANWLNWFSVPGSLTVRCSDFLFSVFARCQRLSWSDNGALCFLFARRRAAQRFVFAAGSAESAASTRSPGNFECWKVHR